MIVAFVQSRPDSWGLPLFLHVLGAMALTGATAAVAVLALAAGRQADPDRGRLLRRLVFRTLLLAAIPAYVLMRVAAEWINSKEGDLGDPAWLGIGFSVADGGLVVLVLLTIFTGLGARRDRTWPTRVTVVVAPLYLAALAVAVWAMTAKPT